VNLEARTVRIELVDDPGEGGVGAHPGIFAGKPQ
jgi:hypothetical protein